MKRLVFLVACHACAAAEFVNLTFDAPDTSGLIAQADSHLPKGNVENLLPGWSVRYGQTLIERVYFSDVGGPDVERRGITLFSTLEFQRDVLGKHSLGISHSRDQTDGVPRLYTVTLSQQGQIPSEALGLWVDTSAYNTEFRLDGQLVDWNHDPNGYVDLRGFAGQDVLLSITFPVGDGGIFDIRGFAVVPEPSTWALIGVGAAALLFVTRRKH